MPQRLTGDVCNILDQEISIRLRSSVSCFYHKQNKRVATEEALCFEFKRKHRTQALEKQAELTYQRIKISIEHDQRICHELET